MSVQDIIDGINRGIENHGDAGIDHSMMIEATSNISRVLSVLYGVLVVLIYIAVPVMISLEIMYICFPIIRSKTEEFLVKIEGRGFMCRTLGFTLRDAREAVYRANTIDTGKSPIYIYLVMKCKSVTVIMFIIFIVLNGRENIIRFVWSLVDRAVGHIF